jgi:hypothetical protein
VGTVYRKTLARNLPPLDHHFPMINGRMINFDSEFGKHLQKHPGRRVAKWFHYVDIYDKLLREFKIKSDSGEFSILTPLKFLEIGVQDGGSLEIWSSYFDKSVRVFGIDIDKNCANISIPGVAIRIGSQDDPEFLLQIISELGSPHMIIDDGSHHVDHVEATLRVLWPHLQDDGIYIIEDTHTSYWKNHGGGYLKRKTIIELIKQSIDLLHQPYTRRKMPNRVQFLSGSLSSVTVHDSMIVLRKHKTAHHNKRVEFGVFN